MRWLSKGSCLQRFIKLWDSIVSFLANTQLGEQLRSTKCDVFEQFLCLASISSDVNDENLLFYFEYLENMQRNLVIPFEVNVADVDVSLQETLLELQSGEALRTEFKDTESNIWKANDIATKYPLLWDKAQLYVIAFPSSYLVEAEFSRFFNLLSKVRNRLDIMKRGDLRLSLTWIEPDINKLAEQHQPQRFH